MSSSESKTAAPSSSSLSWGDIDDKTDVNTVLSSFNATGNPNANAIASANKSNTNTTPETNTNQVAQQPTTATTELQDERKDSSKLSPSAQPFVPKPTPHAAIQSTKTAAVPTQPQPQSSISASNTTNDADVNNAADALSKTAVSDKSGSSDADGDDDYEAETGLHPNDKTAEVEIIGSGTNIYRAAESFESLGLRAELLNGVYDMKFTSPSKIQAQALPIILDAKHPNLIGQAQHGSGKTAAFCLGLLSRVDESRQEPQAIVVCPTRELAQQVTDVAKSLAKYTKITIETIIPKTRQEVAAAANPTITDTRTGAGGGTGAGRQPIISHVLVGTPGSLKQRIDVRAINIRSIRVFVADEADQMVSREEGLGDQTIAIKSKMPRDCQILLFSATFDGKTSDFAKRVAPRAVEIRIKTEELSLEGIKQFYVESRSFEEKYKALSSIFSLLEIGATIIFVQTVATAKWLTNQMRSDGYTVSLLHGKDMAPEERDRVMNDFRQNKTNVLITTNVLARGIDVLSVTLVINYDIPVTKYHRADFSTYIHRIGRSGRFGRKGVAINFVSDEMSKRLLQEIAEHFGKKLDVDLVRLPVEDIEKSSQIVQKALGKGT